MTRYDFGSRAWIVTPRQETSCWSWAPTTVPKAIASSKDATLPPLSLSRQDVDFQHFLRLKIFSWVSFEHSWFVMMTMSAEPSRCVCGVDAARDFLTIILRARWRRRDRFPVMSFDFFVDFDCMSVNLLILLSDWWDDWLHEVAGDSCRFILLGTRSLVGSSYVRWSPSSGLLGSCRGEKFFM